MIHITAATSTATTNTMILVTGVTSKITTTYTMIPVTSANSTTTELIL